MLAQRCQVLEDEAKKLESTLDKSRESSNRLHKESEQVITNVNSWVQEQRNSSEKLTAKLKEQSTVINALNYEKEALLKDNEAMRQHLKNINQNIENSALDREKIKVSSVALHSIQAE